MTKTKVLVTGGAGYIGSVLVPELLDQGFDVTVLDSFMFGQAGLNQCVNNVNFCVEVGDVRNEEIVKDLVKNKDIIIPLAGLVGAPLCNKDPIAATTTNHDAVIMMLNNISKNQIILMPTTNSAYGSGGAGNKCNEDSPLFPLSQYAIEKVEVEKKLMMHENAISFRLATVFGMSPRMRIDLLVNDFTYRAVRDKFIVLFESHFKRNYIHVRDVVRCFIHGINNFDNMKGEIFNVGLSNANLSKLELCLKIKEYVPEFSIFEDNIGADPDKRDYVVSNQKIENTGFKPEHSIDDGIVELIKGYKMLKNNQYGNV